jgi:hypothetical protein
MSFPYLNADLLSTVREQMSAQLTDTCLLYEANTGVSDGMGGTKPGGTTPDPVSFPCRLQHISSLPESERESAQKLQSDYYIVLPYDADLGNAKYAVVSGKRLEIRSPSTPRTDNLTTRVAARLVGPSQV